MRTRLLHIELIIIAVLFLIPFRLFCQEAVSDRIYYERIKEDSFRLFFNEEGKFMEKKCASLIRYVKINIKANFNGYFIDAAHNNSPAGRGRYIDGEKHGDFETYFANGKTRSKGAYHRNIPLGKWEYFYENGLPERTLMFTETDTLLMRFVDNKGNVTVAGGNGRFNGPIGGPAGISRNVITARGKIRNGKPHGRWQSTIFGGDYCMERFKEGKFIKGELLNPMIKKNYAYTSRSNLNSFLLNDYLTGLEQFFTGRCKGSAAKNADFDFKTFSADLKEKISTAIENEVTSGRIQHYGVGHRYLSVKFSIDQEGKPTDFVLLHAWGKPFFTAIKESITTHATFLHQQEAKYFHILLSFSSGFSHVSKFAFSNGRSLKF